MRNIVLIVFLALSFSFSQAQDNPQFSLAQLLKIKKIEKTFTGNFDNKAQADTTKIKMLAHQKVRVLRIWKKQKAGQYWMYSGWFYGEDETAPFQEVLYQITAMEGDTMVMQSYVCPPQLRAKGLLREKEWAEQDAFARISLQDVVPFTQFIIFPHGAGYRMESRPFIGSYVVPGSAFDRIAFSIDRYDKSFILNNEYYHKGSDEKIVLPQGVQYEWKTSNPKKF